MAFVLLTSFHNISCNEEAVMFVGWQLYFMVALL